MTGTGPSPRPRRRLQTERLLLAGAASFLAVVLSGIIAAAGYLPVFASLTYGIVVAVLVATFFLLFRTGLNKRFADPGLTVPQLLAAGFATSYVLYHGMDARGAVIGIFLIAFMFGMLTLDARRLTRVAAAYVLCYVAVIVLWLLYKPEALDLRRELFGVLAVALILAWFTGLGAYIARLRGDLGRTGAELAKALEDAQALARVDALTGCYNRRYAMELLAKEAQRTARGHELTLCLADIDHFKAINDRLGHQAGDEVLKSFAASVKECLRATDILARYGGEEFLVTFSDSSSDDALRIAERIRRSVEQMRVAMLPPGANVTVSLGLAQHVHPEPLDATLARADQALYLAKSSGRNRVVLGAGAAALAAPSISPAGT